MKFKSESSQAAILIRKELKNIFAATKFSVNSSGNNINVSWLNGPSSNEIKKITVKYKAGNFDTMQDSYDFNNKNDLPKCMFINIIREISEELYIQELGKLTSLFPCLVEFGLDEYNEIIPKKLNYNTVRQYIRATLTNVNL